ncbi:hypothetical protein NKI61_10735 [Mesorhizobium sp. M0514]|uniref:hypothetical protein n=1 Tax=Mesorhizobium sp. M0514 TaxID=2956955 RepID=UPI00333A0574
MTLPVDRLPASKPSRHAVLRDYFCDKDATSVLGDAGWHLNLSWPDGLDRHVDPRLQEGLAWWGDNVTLPIMALARTRKQHVLSVLYDTWTLQSWSEWVHAAGISSDEHVLILHVDDHRDLASPRLFEGNGRWKDAITGSFCDLGDPASVRTAIESGAIGMGSFLTPFLHGFPKAEVRQLCQPPKVTKTQDFAIGLIRQADDLLDPSQFRPAVQLTPTVRQTGPGLYRSTPNLDDWLEDLPTRPTVLHIDMDFFNNRYDGDTDWQSREKPFDPPLDHILGKIDDVTAALNRSVLGSQLADIVVAYSPGFFPAEYWQEATDRIVPALERIYGR